MSTAKNQVRKSIALYLLFTFLICSPFYYLIIQAGNMGAGVPGISYTLIIMWCPTLGTLLTCRVMKIKLGSLGWKWGPAKYLWWSYLIPIIYSLVAYLFIWISGKGGFYNKETVAGIAKGFGWTSLPDGLVILFYILLVGSFSMARSMSSAIGEEIGWRGFLTPQLAKISSYTGTSLWTGVIWAIYHYPLLLFANYNSGAPAWYSLTCFTVMVIAMCFVFTWFRMKSGSLWTAALLHASHNLFIQMIFTPLTFDTGDTKYYIDEFGIVLPVVSVIAAIICWTKRKELPPFKVVDAAPST